MGWRTVRGRVLAAAVVWLAVAAVVRVAVAAPEHCPAVDAPALRAAAVEAVGWFDRNQAADGTWLYRYDRAADRDVGGYNTVRHAGVVMSLYQAHAAGLPDALAGADAGTAYALDHLVAANGGLAFEPSSTRVTTGAAALLLAGLAERRAATGDDVHDEVMAALGRFLVGQTEGSGAVLEAWDRRTGAPVPGIYSPFFTGEAYWALALLHREDPDGGWDEPAARIGHYLATERDAAEGHQPDVPDHWAAYGLATTAAWPERSGGSRPLTAAEAAYADRQARLAGVQVRWESQRTDAWPNWWLRGRRTLGAGLGTLGEHLHGLWRVALVDERTAPLAAVLAERGRCVGAMLVDRQVGPDEAARFADPSRTRGAWFQFEVTQMDDQQHALSALLFALDMLDAAEGPA